MPLPLGSVGPPRRGCHLLREPQAHTLPGPGDLDPLLLAMPVLGWVTHGPAPACCQPDPGVQRGHRVPQQWLEVVDTVRPRLGPGHAPPPGGRLGYPTTCEPGNKKTEFSSDVAPGKARRGQPLTPAAVSVLCDGGPGGVECSWRGLPGDTMPSSSCPLRGGFLALGKVRVPALCGASLRGCLAPRVLGEKALAGLC